MQNAALEAVGLGGEWSYEAIEVSPDELGELVRSLPERGFAGANVTIPHKEAALELADEASPAAREIGAANTLSFDEGGVAADNTDAPGLLAALPRSPAGLSALVLGAGGSARAVAWALAAPGRGRRLEPDPRARRRAGSQPRRRRGGQRRRRAAAGAGQRRAGPDQRLRPDRQLHRARPRRRGRRPLRGPPARSRPPGPGRRPDRPRLRPPRHRAGPARPRAGRGGDRRRRGAGPPGRRVVPDLDRQGGAARRDARGCEARGAEMSEAEYKLTPSESVTVMRSEVEVLEVEAIYGPEGSPPPKHFHPAQDERFTILEGRLTTKVDGVERELAEGRGPRHPPRLGAPDVERGPEPARVSGRRVRPGGPRTGFARSTPCSARPATAARARWRSGCCSTSTATPSSWRSGPQPVMGPLTEGARRARAASAGR